MKAELIAVGTELLLGEITDTNATFISQRLAEIGVDLYFRHTVGDNLQRLAGQLSTSVGRSDVVILCGGIGPTEDDLTREAIAEAVGRPLRRDPQALEHLKRFFAERGRIPTEVNFKQCDAPEGGQLLDNTCGTAPGVYAEHGGCMIFAVPGPPPEMREMMRLQVLPRLVARASAEGGGVIHTRTLLLCDIGESNVAEVLKDLITGQADPTIALYASPALVKVRLATKDTDTGTAQARMAPVEAVIRERLAANVFGVDEDTMESAVGRMLRERGETLAVAESCTGGLIASRVTDVSGASEYLLGGIVAYANEVKMELLGVPAGLLAQYGAVSEECAKAMAEGVRKKLGATWGLATTGIAGPTGGTPEKPVGLVFIALAGPDGTTCECQNWPSTRDQFKQRVSQMALGMLRKALLGPGS